MQTLFGKHAILLIMLACMCVAVCACAIIYIYVYVYMQDTEILVAISYATYRIAGMFGGRKVR